MEESTTAVAEAPSGTAAPGKSKSVYKAKKSKSTTKTKGKPTPSTNGQVVRKQPTIYLFGWDGQENKRIYWKPGMSFKDMQKALTAVYGDASEGRCGPGRKEGLRTFQIRILLALSGKDQELTIKEIADVADLTSMIIHTGMGPIDPELREKAAESYGYSGLLQLGYAKTQIIESRSGKNLTGFVITPAGQKALDKVEESGYVLPAKRKGRVKAE